MITVPNSNSSLSALIYKRTLSFKKEEKEEEEEEEEEEEGGAYISFH